MGDIFWVVFLKQVALKQLSVVRACSNAVFWTGGSQPLRQDDEGHRCGELRWKITFFITLIIFPILHGEKTDFLNGVLWGF